MVALDLPVAVRAKVALGRGGDPIAAGCCHSLRIRRSSSDGGVADLANDGGG